jgi:hypothetical protein
MKDIRIYSMVNKYHEKYGDKSTIVALNMLNGMYHNHKNNIQKHLFQNAIKLGKKEMKIRLNLSVFKIFTKNKDYEDAYQNLALFNELTTALNIEEKLNKAKVAGINLEIDEYKREIDKIGNEYKTKESLLLKSNQKKKILILLIVILFFSFPFYIFQRTA